MVHTNAGVVAPDTLQVTQQKNAVFGHIVVLMVRK